MSKKVVMVTGGAEALIRYTSMTPTDWITQNSLLDVRQNPLGHAFLDMMHLFPPYWNSELATYQGMQIPDVLMMGKVSSKP